MFDTERARAFVRLGVLSQKCVFVCACVCAFKLTLGRGAHAGQPALIALSITVDGLVGLKENKPNPQLRHSSTYTK